MPCGVLVRTQVHSSIVTCLAWSDNGNLIATGSTDCSLIMWDAATGNKLRTCVGHTGSVQAVCFLTNARIVSGSSDKSVMLWDADNGKKLQRYMASSVLVVSSMFLDFCLKCPVRFSLFLL